MRLPVLSQNAASSGRQSTMSGPDAGRGGTCTGLTALMAWSFAFSGKGSALEAEFDGPRSHHLGTADFGPVHPDQRDPDDGVHQHEGRGAHAGEVEQGAEDDRQDEAAQTAGETDD